MKYFLIFIFLTMTCIGYSQDLTGSWSVKYTSYQRNVTKYYNASIYLSQKGKAVWGVFANGNKLSIDSAVCSCTIQGKVGKDKDAIYFKMYKDDVITYQATEDVCQFLNYFEFGYEKRADGEYLVGKWFGSTSNRFLADGSAGNILLKKMAATPVFDVDRYFPKLPKMIEKMNRGDTAYKAAASK